MSAKKKWAKKPRRMGIKGVTKCAGVTGVCIKALPYPLPGAPKGA